jgi:hypothetical protein
MQVNYLSESSESFSDNDRHSAAFAGAGSAKAGIQIFQHPGYWMPACAGKTNPNVATDGYINAPNPELSLRRMFKNIFSNT